MAGSLVQELTRKLQELQEAEVHSVWLSESNRQAMQQAARGIFSFAEPSVPQTDRTFPGTPAPGANPCPPVAPHWEQSLAEKTPGPGAAPSGRESVTATNGGFPVRPATPVSAVTAVESPVVKTAPWVPSECPAPKEAGHPIGSTGLSTGGTLPEAPVLGANPPSPAEYPGNSNVPENGGWEELERVFSGCRACGSAAVRSWEYGMREARVMFIGDFPHSSEPLSETPAGQMLIKMGQAMKLHWTDAPSRATAAYTSDVLKCMPPARPTPEQIQACLPFLKRQIELVAPDALVLLGQLPTRVLTGKTEAFLQLRGTWQSYNGIPAVVIQHPVQILRFQNQPAFFLQERRTAWTTLQQLIQFLGL